MSCNTRFNQRQHAVLDNLGELQHPIQSTAACGTRQNLGELQHPTQSTATCGTRQKTWVNRNIEFNQRQHAVPHWRLWVNCNTRISERQHVVPDWRLGVICNTRSNHQQLVPACRLWLNFRAIQQILQPIQTQVPACNLQLISGWWGNYYNRFNHWNNSDTRLQTSWISGRSGSYYRWFSHNSGTRPQTPAELQHTFRPFTQLMDLVTMTDWSRGRDAAAREMMMNWCLMSSDVMRHIRDKLWPMPKHGAINLYVHGNQKAR